MKKSLFPFFTTISILILGLFYGSSARTESRKKQYNIPVICYHHVTDKFSQGFNVKVNEFEKQLEYLKVNGYQPITLDQFYRAMKGEEVAEIKGKPVLLSFDDGSKSVFQNAFPLLKKYQFKSTLFLYPTVISNPRHPKYLSWNEVQIMLKSGLFDVGSHSYYHPRMIDLTEKEIKDQLVLSRKSLEEKLDVKVKDFAFPFGLYDERILKLTKGAGYRTSYTINPGNNQTGDDLYTLQRVLIKTDDSVKTFAGYLKINTINHIKIFPEDSAIVQAGNAFIVDFTKNTPDQLTISINGKNIPLKQNKNRFSGHFPFFKNRKILVMNLVSKNNSEKQGIRAGHALPWYGSAKDGPTSHTEKSSRQFLYILKKENTHITPKSGKKIDTI